MKKTSKNLTLSALFVALGLLLPFLTGQIPHFGRMLLPMHFPVFLCGLICGWQYGLIVGLIVPVFRSLLFGQPMMYPVAISMALELAVYGLLTGLLYQKNEHKNRKSLFSSIIIAMLGGRAVWGIAQIAMLGIGGEHGFTWKAFMGGAFLNAIPGIILQLILIPIIIEALGRAGLIPFETKKEK